MSFNAEITRKTIPKKKNEASKAVVVVVVVSIFPLIQSITACFDATDDNEPQRQRAIRAVFLDSFGTSLAQRADNFSAAFCVGGPGERAEVTTHQMRRFFGLCGSPSNAKVSLYLVPTFGLTTTSHVKV